MQERKHLTAVEVDRLIATTKGSRNEVRDRIRQAGGRCEGLKSLRPDLRLGTQAEIKCFHRPHRSRKPMTLKVVTKHLNATGIKTRTARPWIAANVAMTIQD